MEKVKVIKKGKVSLVTGGGITLKVWCTRMRNPEKHSVFGLNKVVVFPTKKEAIDCAKAYIEADQMLKSTLDMLKG